jgi:acyl-CoA thioester hydrolase
MRVKIPFPDRSPLAVFHIPVRIGDINYGGHVGNDAVLSILHEARMQWLASAGYTEMETGGHGLIMADVMISYRGESFYGDVLRVALFADSITSKSFDLLYRLETSRDGGEILIAEAKTGMIAFDYNSRKIIQMSKGLAELLSWSK